MSEKSINIKQWKTSFTSIPAKYLHFASKIQLQPGNCHRLVKNVVEIIPEQSSRKLYHLKESICNYQLQINYK